MLLVWLLSFRIPTPLSWPTVHIIGTLLGAKDFSGAALYCHFNILPRGSHWTLLAGSPDGETQVVDLTVRGFHSANVGSVLQPVSWPMYVCLRAAGSASPACAVEPPH